MRSILLSAALGLAAAAAPAAAQPPVMNPTEELPSTSKLTLALDAHGHTATIAAVLFAPDGKRLITTAADNSIRIWDVATGEPVKVLYPPGQLYPKAASLSPDGQTLAIGLAVRQGDKKLSVIALLRLAEGSLRTLPTEHRHLRALAFAPDGQTLASSGEDSHVRLWQLPDGALKETYKTPASVLALAFAPDGKRLVEVRHQEAAIRELATGKLVPLKGGRIAALASYGTNLAAWSRDGSTVATCADDGVRLWSPDGTLQHHLRQKTKAFTAAFNPSSKQVLVIWDEQLPASLFEVRTGKFLRYVPSDQGKLHLYGRNCVFSPDGKLAATTWVGTGSHELLLSKAADGTVLRRLAAKNWLVGPSSAAGWTGEGLALAWRKNSTPAAAREQLAAFNLQTLRLAPLLAKPSGATPRLDALSLKFVSGNLVEVLQGSKVVTRLQPPGMAKLIAPSMSLVGTERAALLADGYGFFLFDARSGKNIKVGPHSAQVASLAPSPDGRFLLTLSHNHTLSVWAAQTGELLLTLYVAGQDWVAWTPQGYYAATPGGERLIGWKVDRGADQLQAYFPVSRFRKQLYRPDVLKLLLETGSVAAALKSANAAAGIQTPSADLETMQPPKVTLVVDRSTPAQVTIKARAVAASREQPVTALRLLLDGRPLPGSETLVELGAGKAEAAAAWTVTIPAGEHRLAVFARSPDTSAVSESVTITRTPSAQLPVLHVLTVGINQYADTTLNLDFASKDAAMLADSFRSHCKGALFGEVLATKLLDAQARKKAVLDQLEKVRKTAKENDLFVVFFACHGAKEKERFYLLTVEADTMKLDQTALSGDDLRKALGAFPCQVLLMLDACHNAGFGEGRKLRMQGLRPATDDATRALTDDDIGGAVFCAAMGDEQAQEKDGHGLFTRFVLEALKAGPEVQRNPFDKYVYIHHLRAYVTDHVAHYSGQRQHPFLSLPLVVQSFPVR